MLAFMRQNLIKLSTRCLLECLFFFSQQYTELITYTYFHNFSNFLQMIFTRIQTILKNNYKF